MMVFDYGRSDDGRDRHVVGGGQRERDEELVVARLATHARKPWHSKPQARNFSNSRSTNRG
jgi:hypothetical protein